MSVAAVHVHSDREVVGRCFLHPAFDYLLIGGGLSLVATAVVIAVPDARAQIGEQAMWCLLLASPMAHFAASTVRLYSKPGDHRSSWVAMGLPLFAFVAVVACLSIPDRLGPHFFRLYLTWSPYHYAAQSYGLAVMYCYRSGCSLGAGNKGWLRWASLMPFFAVFLDRPDGGLQWLIPALIPGLSPSLSPSLSPDWIAQWPGATQLLGGATRLLQGLALLAPIALIAKARRRDDQPMPLIAPLLLVSNAVWWIVLPPIEAFVWATIFHGIQYLAITLIFNARDQVARPGNRHGATFHTLRFYAMSVVLGYTLFRAIPFGYVWAGYGLAESLLTVTAAINIHHFIVDRFIWRLGRSDSNRAIVEA